MSRSLHPTCGGLQRAVLAVVLLFASALAGAERLGDVADLAGVRDNQLVGYGLVVGLDGSGDQTMQAPFTGQSLTNMLSQLGISVPAGTNMQLRNVAAVMVTATLPPFATPGQHLDVVVSSVGNARSLRGGTLLMTPLKGIDGQTYALAQGNLMVGGAGAEAGGSSVQINQQAGGRIARGATVEREVPLQLGGSNGLLELNLREPGFTAAQRTVAAINREFGRNVARALNGGTVQLQGPLDSNDRVNFLARVENVEIDAPDAPPRVVINARTGSVVLNQRVTLRPAAVAHGNLRVTIGTVLNVNQPPPFSGGETVLTPETEIEIEDEPGSLNLVEGAELSEVVAALNALGASPQDLMSILEALQASGALRAELEIL